MEYITSQKGGIILKYKSFLFQKERETTEKIIWRCLEYTTKKCRGRLHSFGEVVLRTTDHNHVPDIGKIEAKETIEKLKETAKNTQLTTHCVVGTITSEVNFITHFWITIIVLDNNLHNIIDYTEHSRTTTEFKSIKAYCSTNSKNRNMCSTYSKIAQRS